MTTLIILNLIFFILLSLLKPRLSLFFILISLPTYLIRFSIFKIPFTLIEAQILILSIKFLIDLFRKKITLPKVFFFKEIFLWLFVAILAVCISSFSLSSLGAWKAYFLEPLLLFLITISYLNKKDDWKKIVYSLSFSALIVSLFAIYQKITGNFIPNPFWQAVETRRVTSFFSYPNAIGLYLAPITMLGVSVIFSNINTQLNKKTLLKTAFLILTSFLSVLSIYFAKSEGALIALALGLMFFLFFYNKKIRKLLSFFLLLSFVFIIFNQNAFTYLKNKTTLQDKSGQIRISQWQETWKMLQTDKNWLKGSGLNNYQNKIEPFHKEGIFIEDKQDPNWLRKVLFNEEFRKTAWQPLEIYLYPHNIILNFWTELGFLGLIVFLIIIGKYLYYSLKLKNKKISLTLISVMLVIFIHGMVDVPYFKNDLSLLFWIIISILVMNLNTNESKKNTIK